MSKNYHEGMAEIREAARAHGGDALVAKVDEAHAKELALRQTIQDHLDAMLSAAEGDKDGTDIAYACVCEALSGALAKAALDYGKQREKSTPQIMVTTIQSVVANLNAAFADADIDKTKGAATGLMDKVLSAFKGDK